jgi:uridine kinase
MYFIGIAGGSGSGKTTFVNKITRHFSSDKVAILSMDSYYLPRPPEHLYDTQGIPNFDHPDAIDWELLKSHLITLKKGEKVLSPIYDFTIHERTPQTCPVGPAKVVLFEGIFALFENEIREMLDIKCFLLVDTDIRFIRRLHRDLKERGRTLENIIEQYYGTVRPMYQKYLITQKDYADIIVGEENETAASLLSSQITYLLSR